jgi:hypothetical protein
MESSSKTEDPSKEKQRQTMLKVYELLLDIAHKELKPIDLIKETGSDFILG